MRGYGSVVIVDHGNGLETRYAHNRRNRVGRGQRVERGQVIGEVGSSGNASAPHVHFEVRKRGRALDPMAFLPARPALAQR
jgi:murein DD-endopeptidase MepM/ murein hydrolase activator NlpD